MGRSFCFPWEVPLMELIQSAECPLFNKIAAFVSMIGEEYSAFWFIYRFFRYTLSTFIIIGPYPYLFKRFRFL